MMQIPHWMAWLQRQFEEQQRQLSIGSSRPWSAWPVKWKWPWQGVKERKQSLEKDYNRKLQAVCSAVKAENVGDLQDLLGAMVLSECVYKKPESEVLRAVNKFKADFGGQLVPVDCIQTSLEHVTHRYVLAEAGNTLFVSFIGTKQYKDLIADANFLQGPLFGDEDEAHKIAEEEEHVISGPRKGLGLNADLRRKRKGKPAAHRGFLARAKGIPATELYRLAQKKDCKLVLCGHSLGGAVAVLATIAILRASAASSVSRPGNRVRVKCITFSQPPVGNAALRDYVHRKGWQQHFQTYCIPEDIIPRILSPAYFRHYRSQAVDFIGLQTMEEQVDTNGNLALKNRNGDQMALGIGPVPSPFWRIPRLVPLASVQKSVQWFKSRGEEAETGRQVAGTNSEGDVTPVQPLEIKEATDRVALASVSSESNLAAQDLKPVTSGKREQSPVRPADWRNRVPSLPSYVPFGQLYLLEKTSVEALSASEYTQLTSMQSVLLELRDRFQSHSMRSYRSRFQNIFNTCMAIDAPLTVNGAEYFPHLRQWFGALGAQVAEVGRISDPIRIRMATAMAPLGWTGLLGEKKGCQPLKVDILGYGLHLCTLVRAQVNGQWCSTSVESFPALPVSEPHGKPRLQRMCIRIGAPLQQSTSDSKNAAQVTIPDGGSGSLVSICEDDAGAGTCAVQGLGEVIVSCSTDFVTDTRKVAVRVRRVRLLGFEGAGKTSLYFALLGTGGTTISNSNGGVLPDMDWREGVVGGVSYVDAPGVNLQDLPWEAEQLKQELAVKVGPNSKKLDLVILVHNLAHKIPLMHSSARPALALLVDEVIAAGIPFILAITNKFAVSADRRHAATLAVMDTYKVPPGLTSVINSCPLMIHGIANPLAKDIQDEHRDWGQQAHHILSGPFNLVQRPFRKREVVLGPEGVQNLQALVHSMLLQQEEVATEEFARQNLALETAKELANATLMSGRHGQGKFAGATTAAAVGAGFGVIVAVIVGAATSLRKP
jgi:hypothetical protein